MEPLCEFCGVVRAAVYCKSDSARLCLDCDGCVHSANALSRRHSRCLLCDKCNSQIAIVHCMDHKFTLCQDCDWNRNECSVLGHRRLAINSYTGCPSLAELSRIWFNVFDANSSPIGGGGSSSGVLESLGTLPKNDSCSSKSLDQHDNDGSFGLVGDRLNEMKQEPYVRYKPWVGQPHIISSSPDYMSCSRDQALFFPHDSNEPNGCPDTIKDLGTSDGNGLCEGLNVDDVQLNFQNADEIFEDGRMECLLMDKHISVTESNGLIESSLEASSSVQQDCVAFQSSAVGDNSVMQPMNSNTNCALMNPSCNNLGFPEGQVHSSIPVQLSDIAHENGATEYQDCGLPPVFLTGETPWESNLEGTSPQARDKAKSRYYEKKKNRSFGKQIRYESRKARADTRKRVKGRFVKASEEYDNDSPVAGDT